MIDKEPPLLNFRYTLEGDGHWLRLWLKDPSIAPWVPIVTPRDLEIVASGWIDCIKFRSALTALLPEQLAAMAVLFVLPYKKVSHQAQLQMVVAPHLQRQGIGRSLLKNILHLAKEYLHLRIVTIEIVDGAPVSSLLKEFNFKEFARQEGYFKLDGGYKARLLLECIL